MYKLNKCYDLIINNKQNMGDILKFPRKKPEVSEREVEDIDNIDDTSGELHDEESRVEELRAGLAPNIISFADAVNARAEERRKSAPSTRVMSRSDGRTSTLAEVGSEEDESHILQTQKIREMGLEPLNMDLPEDVREVIGNFYKWLSRRQKKQKLVNKLNGISDADIAREVELRRELIRDFLTSGLLESLKDSSEIEWIAEPSYYMALVEELESRNFK